MGHEIVYCVRCATRIAGADFERGKAFRTGGIIVCAKCHAETSPLPSPEQPKAASVSTTKLRGPAKPAGSSGTSVRVAPVRAEAPEKSRTPLLIGVGLGVAALLSAGMLTLRSSPAPVESPPVRPVELTPAAKTPAPAPAEKAEEPPLREAREAIEAARAKAKAAPQDPDAQLAAWEEAARKAALTPHFKEANAALQELRDRRAAARPKEPEKPVVAAPPEPQPKLSSTESKAFLVRWESAMAKASARDFEGAADELGRAAAEFNEEALKKEARADAGEFRRAGTLRTEALAALGRLPKGQTVALNARSESGEGRRVEGGVVHAGAARLEIREGAATVYVETEDVAAASLAAIAAPRSDAERRSFALLCLLEGDRAAAERLTGSDGLASRFWDYARDAAAKIPKAPPRELEARRRFYSAESEFTKMESLAAAVSKYKSLLEDYADTRVVKSELPRLQKRAEAGREYVFMPNGLKGTGTFAVAPAPRTEFAWASKADVEGSLAAENYVEAEFAALPETAYRAWVLAGGCCAETFTVYLQTTEGTELHPKTRQKTSIEPGAALAALLKTSISGLKKTHEDHKIKGSKVHPKTAARWEWIAIPLPRYSGPGPRKIRLMSDQQGFAVGAVVVSATRAGPPSEDELKAEVARAHAEMETEPLLPVAKPWRPLFDGKSIDAIRANTTGWKFENGVIAHVHDVNDAAQTREEISDGELRVRFELKDLQRASFTLRQGGGGGYGVAIEGDLKAMEGKPHEILFVAKGDQVTATLDGKPLPVTSFGASARGCLQFNAQGKTLNILSIDVR